MGEAAVAMEYVCFSDFSFLPPVSLQPEWMLGSGVPCSWDVWKERSFSLHKQFTCCYFVQIVEIVTCVSELDMSALYNVIFW